MGEPDLLSDVLALARAEGALADEGIEAFAAALRERAQAIIEERLRAVAEMDGVLNRANEAHEKLLAHHRRVLRQIAAELRAVAALPVYWRWDARRRLRALAEGIETEVS